MGSDDEEKTTKSAGVPAPTPRNVLLLVGVLAIWTLVLSLLGVGPLSMRPSLPLARPLRSHSRGGAAPTSEEDAVEREWAEKLLGDLEASSVDDATAATVMELKASLARRDELRTPPAALAAARRPAARSIGGPLPLAAYDAGSTAELQRAAAAAAAAAAMESGANGTGGFVSQLLHDMSAALAQQERAREGLHQKLAMLQPAVADYSPDNVNQLINAAEGATAPGEVSGALPQLLRHVSTALKKQTDAAARLASKVERTDRASRRAADRVVSLRQMLLSRAHGDDLVSVMFAELREQCAACLLYTSPSPRDKRQSRMPSSA